MADPAILENDELPTFDPSDTELFLYTVSCMIDTMLEQLLWLKVVVDEELDRAADEDEDLLGAGR